MRVVSAHHLAVFIPEFMAIVPSKTDSVLDYITQSSAYKKYRLKPDKVIQENNGLSAADF